MPDDWTPELYKQLKKLARLRFRSERSGHTLQATALVNEVWLRMRDRGDDWVSRRQFFVAASTAMRRILVEHARHRQRVVRGGGVHRVTLADAPQAGIDQVELLALDEALDRLAAEDARSAQTVELHYFAGQSADEIADLLGVSAPTVRRDLDFARRFLAEQLDDYGSTEGS